jgi:peptidoglycan L-alanyl-D-glutamate endopeptidase CwlK
MARIPIENMLKDIESAGIPICISCTYRDNDEQKMLFMQGRQPLAAVNAERKRLGFWPITTKENRIVTNVETDGPHNRRVAIDIYPLCSGKIVTSARDPVWRKFDEIAEKNGVTWGGDFKSIKDMPHFQVGK